MMNILKTILFNIFIFSPYAIVAYPVRAVGAIYGLLSREFQQGKAFGANRVYRFFRK